MVNHVLSNYDIIYECDRLIPDYIFKRNGKIVLKYGMDNAYNLSFNL